MKGFTYWFKVFNIVCACIQNMTLGGIIFGWASISGGLLASSPSTGGAGLSPDYIQMLFVTATFFSFLGPLSLGIVLDNFGPRVCSLTSISLIAIGCLLFGFSDRDHRPFFMPALCLIALGGPGAQSAIIHLSNLFPNWKATTTAIITGSFQLSFIVFLIFDQLWLLQSFSYSSLFIGYAFICSINGIISFFLWPDEPYSFEEQLAEIEEEEGIDEEIQVPIGHIRLPSVFIHHNNVQVKPLNVTSTLPPSNLSKDSLRERSNKSPTKLPPAVALKEGSLLEQVKSAEFIRLVGFFLVNSFWVNFYIGSFDVQLGDENILSSSEKLNYARLFTLIITLGVVAIPIVGTIMDRYNFPTASATTTVCGLLWATFLVAETKFSLVLSFIFYSIFRTFLFTLVFAYLADTLGFKYFGVLAGIMFVLGGVLSILQVPIIEFASGTCHIDTSNDSCIEGNWKVLNMCMGLMICCTFYFSYKDWITREENKILTEIAMHRPQEDETESLIQTYRPISGRYNIHNELPPASNQSLLLSSNNNSKISYGSVTKK